MGEQNVAIVKRGWEHFQATGEPPADLMAPDFVWDMSTFRGWPEQPQYHGVGGMRQFLGDWSSAFEDWSIAVESMHDAGDKVVCVCHQHGHARTTGLAVDMRLALIFTVRDGVETHMQMYAEPAEALAAAGLD